ncbi:MAG: SH3 domain-containing protein, partial [Candidatus Yanofskybacteria bacterium]|nr:SH3 domain-containing protein [Candidatus Yanofskybacteria bacterium]
ASRGFVSLANVSLKDGDVISAAGSSDPDVYIVNPHGYKRLFLNPAIFGFYGHLGGFSKVKGTTSVTRDVFVTSGLFRNCETNDKKVYGVETTGEDTGKLHWVNTSGEQAVADDPNFFKKVFCINTNEFNWYPKGSDYTSVNQIPDYSRKNVVSSVSTPAPVSALKKYKVFDTDQLNVRALAATSSALLGKLPAGSIVESLSQSGLWHKIKYQSKDAWVHGDYLQLVK